MLDHVVIAMALYREYGLQNGTGSDDLPIVWH